MSCLSFFFFKQKTAYEMRISDWSSDVCSSDLRARAPAHIALKEVEQSKQQQDDDDPERCVPAEIHGEYSLQASGQASRRQGAGRPRPFGQRSEEHTSELQSLMRLSYAVFCLTQQTRHNTHTRSNQHSTIHNY